MPQARDIKRRIKSVESTKQITRAMKMVAAAKLRRAQTRMLGMRSYAEHLSRTVDDVAFELFGDEHPLFLTRPETRAATIVIAGDRGLCGGFNASILRRARAHFGALPEVTHSVWSIGKRATLALRQDSALTVTRSYEGVFDNLSYALANEICAELVDAFLGERIDSAYVVYNEFLTVMSQKPVTKRILPFDFGTILAARRERPESRDPARGTGETRLMYELEPSPEAAMARLVGHLIATQVFHATLESYAAELGARMTAMDNATSNADDMIVSLTMDYNRARQTGITSELLDIVGGAEGLAR